MIKLEIEFFDRDKDNVLLPVDAVVDLADADLKAEIAVHEGKLVKADGQDKEVLLKVIEILKDEYEKSKSEVPISFKPIMDYEFTYIRKNLCCEGKETKDQNASIISQKLVKPGINFDDAVAMKDKRLKVLIVSKIVELSFPKRNKTLEAKKKVRELLESLKD